MLIMLAPEPKSGTAHIVNITFISHPDFWLILAVSQRQLGLGIFRNTHNQDIFKKFLHQWFAAANKLHQISTLKPQLSQSTL